MVLNCAIVPGAELCRAASRSWPAVLLQPPTHGRDGRHEVRRHVGTARRPAGVQGCLRTNDDGAVGHVSPLLVTSSANPCMIATSQMEALLHALVDGGPGTVPRTETATRPNQPSVMCCAFERLFLASVYLAFLPFLSFFPAGGANALTRRRTTGSATGRARAGRTSS